MNEIDKYRQSFREEAYEILEELEVCLLELEKKPGDAELVDRIFRALHTLKGSGRMAGFDDIGELAHEVETIYELVRKSEFTVTTDLVDLTLACRDQIHSLLDERRDPRDAGEERTSELISKLRSVIGSPEEATFWIRFKPAGNVLLNGANPISLLSELEELGPCRIVARTDSIPALSEIEPELCYVYWDAILTTDRTSDDIRDVFIFVADDSELQIEKISETWSQLSPESLAQILEVQELLGTQLITAEPGLAESPTPDRPGRTQSQEALSTIRVAADKLDNLVDRVGELVTVQARLSQTALVSADPDLMTVAEEVERLTGELREIALSTRMMPIRAIFSKYKRLVRDLAQQLGREVELTTDGEDTELDKTVIERLDDVLVHLIRNSLDHGIEPPEARLKAGKPAKGRVHLSAVHSGAHVLISIRDDGAGLDRQRIREIAIGKGLIAADEEIADSKLGSLILAPGFTTAKAITTVSGRGVGMDVVKRSIDALRGGIELNSQPGLGMTVTLKLPLTLAMIDSLLVSVGSDTYVLPLNVVNECVELTAAEAAGMRHRSMINLRGEPIPFIRIRDRLVIDGLAAGGEQIVITEENGRRVGIVVDHVIGEHQTVIKTLGGALRNIEGISGATILGDGTVALILDIAKILQLEEEEEVNRLTGTANIQHVQIN